MTREDSDRELLELAAKAAGYVIEGDADKLVAQPGRYAGGFSIYNDRGGSQLWNPLTDDGDALRLAVKAGIGITSARYTQIYAERASDAFASEPSSPDPYAATRRAIVRAAAEIGKAMP